MVYVYILTLKQQICSNLKAIRYVTLYVRDVNDEHPVFHDEPYQYYINEVCIIRTVSKIKKTKKPDTPPQNRNQNNQTEANFHHFHRKR